MKSLIFVLLTVASVQAYTLEQVLAGKTAGGVITGVDYHDDRGLMPLPQFVPDPATKTTLHREPTQANPTPVPAVLSGRFGLNVTTYGSKGGVHCGGHYADTCRECHSSKSSWCNKDCEWQSDSCTYKYKSVFGREVLHATNQFRAKYGKGALKLSNELTASAQDWATKLESSCKFEHRPLPWPKSARAENIAASCEWTPPGSFPVNQWINHGNYKENMLKDNIYSMGVGLGQKRGCSTWCSDPKKYAAIIVAMYGKEPVDDEESSIDTTTEAFDYYGI